MGSDLFSVCVFCAGLLLGTDLAPFGGTSAEIGGAYSTWQRRYDVDSGHADISNVTPKFVLVGLRGVQWPEEGLGAGTPSREWRVRLSLAPSHDEEELRNIGVVNRAAANGTGRYENFALLYRLPLGRTDSLEAAWIRRSHKATDFVNLGGENYEVSEERVLAAERADLALGLRHRWKGLELAAAGRYTRVDAKNATAGANLVTSGALAGASVEARLSRGRWSFTVGGEALSGDLDVHEESLPDFAARNFSARGSSTTVSVSATHAWSSTDLFLAVSRDQYRLPFVAMAVLGTETKAFDGGYHPESHSRSTLVDLVARQRIGRGALVRLSIRAIYGSETVDLTDRKGIMPSLRLPVDWLSAGGKGSGGNPGVLGAPVVALGIGAEIAVGKR